MVQLACMLLAMNPLKFGFTKLCFCIMLLKFSHYLLRLYVLGLHVINHNGHHFAIGQIINMTSHCCPTSPTFHMIKHDPSILQIPCMLHSCDNTRSTPHTIYGHLENEHLLFKTLSKEATFLDVVIPTLGLLI